LQRDPDRVLLRPGVDGIVTCPCGNPQIPAGSTKGCNNFAGGGTGGAILAGSGMPSIASDTLAFQLTQGVASNVTVLFQGTTPFVNTRSGAGVRCVGGDAEAALPGEPERGLDQLPDLRGPGPRCLGGEGLHDRSAGQPSTTTPRTGTPPANGQPGCPGLSFGFNTTNALSGALVAVIEAAVEADGGGADTIRGRAAEAVRPRAFPYGGAACISDIAVISERKATAFERAGSTKLRRKARPFCAAAARPARRTL
jgi:hypothetical protein